VHVIVSSAKTAWEIFRRAKSPSLTGSVMRLLTHFRYANMDFIVLSTLANSGPVPPLTISYDIACQWSRNFKNRIAQFPSTMQPPSSIIKSIKYVIPKFHLNAHGQSCQTKYSLNFLQHSARTDGEEPERWWAHINPVSMSTREMGPGARHDTLDDHAAAWNWRKITSLGEFRSIRYAML
jgi:Kyakuja-Dileera-Zisupton transposase